MMLWRRLQILPDGQEIDLRRAQIVHDLQHFGLVLAETDHDPRFGEQCRIEPLGLIEQAQRMKISRARPYLGVKTRHGFEIVVEDVGPRRDDGFERALLAQEIGGQDLDRGLGSGGADRHDGLGEMLRPAIVEIVAVDRGDDDVRQAEGCHRLADTLRLVAIEQIGPSGRDIAKSAGAGAHPAEDHDRRVLLLPAFADVRAGGFLADGIEMQLAHQPPRRQVFRARPAP